MKRLQIIIVLLFLLTTPGYGQTFLDAYKTYRLDKVSTRSNSKGKKQTSAFIRAQILELDTVFKSYKSKTNFDFNTADTLFLIYYSSNESPYTSHIIIWSGKDTISYRQGFETIKPFQHKRIITYQPFIQPFNRSKGLKLVTERDSLITLVSERDFTTIEHLGDNHPGNHTSVGIYVAYKNAGQYEFETCFPKPFIIFEVYRKE